MKLNVFLQSKNKSECFVNSRALYQKFCLWSSYTIIFGLNLRRHFGLHTCDTLVLFLGGVNTNSSEFLTQFVDKLICTILMLRNMRASWNIWEKLTDYNSNINSCTQLNEENFCLSYLMLYIFQDWLSTKVARVFHGQGHDHIQDLGSVRIEREKKTKKINK